MTNPTGDAVKAAESGGTLGERLAKELQDRLVTLWRQDPAMDIGVPYLRLSSDVRTVARALIDSDEEIRRLVADKERRFPMQNGPSIPWSLAELLYSGYSAQYGTSQSLKRLAERGGFGWAEIECLWKKPKCREAIDAALAPADKTEEKRGE